MGRERVSAAGLAGRHASVLDPSATGPAALTAREREIAQLAATGLSDKQIGERLFLSQCMPVAPGMPVRSRAPS